MTVNLPIISLLKPEYEIDSHAMGRISQTEIPSLELKEMHDVVELREFLVTFHQFTQISHNGLFWISKIPFHKVLILEKLALIIELLLSSIALEALRNASIAITNHKHKEVVLVEI